MGRPRKPGGPTDQGYGVQHKQLRRALLAAFWPGQPCARCGLPMWGPASQIHLDHRDDRMGYLGLSHKRCNLGHRKPGKPGPPPPVSPGRRW